MSYPRRTRKYTSHAMVVVIATALMVGIAITGAGLALFGMAAAQQFPNFGPATILVFVGGSIITLVFVAISERS